MYFLCIEIVDKLLVLLFLYVCTDDVLETFLSEYRKNKKTRQTSHSELQPSTHPISDGEKRNVSEKGVSDTVGGIPEYFSVPEYFSIPELPIGKELVFNILTTWGDKYYVGLTGIEVFTASGEPAVITEVFTFT